MTLTALTAASLALMACGDSAQTGDAPRADQSPQSTEDQTTQVAPRDIVLVTLDTLRHDAVGWLAEHDVAVDGETDEGWRTPTPQLARLAERGIVFTFAQSHGTVTLPTHTSILTGLYPFAHGVRENAGFVLGDEVPTLATRLADEGFATGAFVSAFTIDSRFGLDRGFDVYDDEVVVTSSGAKRFHVSERRGDATVERALAWWRSQEGKRRFLWVHLFDPHAPYEPAQPYSALEPAYRGEVATTDAYLGVLIDQLEAEAPGPLVLVTADHGEGLGDHGERTHGIFAYAPTLQVPLLIAGPGIEARVDDRLARHVDLVPTVLDALGLPGESDLPGRSLLGPPSAETTSYFECLTSTLDRGWAPLRGVVREGDAGRHKLVDLPIPELYDLAADPAETTNLADTERRLRAELQALLPAESAWPPDRGAIDDETAARLRSLGYLADGAAAKESYGPEDDPKRLMHLDQAIHRFSDLFGSGRILEAAEVAEGMVRERASMPIGHTLWTQALLELGRRRDAIGVMQSAMAIGVADHGLQRQLGLTLAEVGRAGEAVSLLEGLARNESADGAEPDPETLSALGLALDRDERPQDAKTTLERALELAPDDAIVHERLSVVWLRLGDPASAQRHAASAVAIDPSLPNAWNNLGVAHYLQGRSGEALDAWIRSLEADPDQFDTLYNVGFKAAELGRVDLARRALRDFIERAPRDRYGADLPQARELLTRLEAAR